MNRVIVMLLCALTGFATAADDLAGGFVSPPASARPWVYWFWMNGNITREGITADLESMERVGVGGVLIMNATQGGVPKGSVHFMSPQWIDMFRYATAEAHRLGMEITMNNDDGWMGSGGPWIRPDQAMQTLTWSVTEVSGPRPFNGTLPQPATLLDYYRDIAVLAMPVPAATNTPPTPKRVGQHALELEYTEPFTARSVTVTTLNARGAGARPSRCELQVSDDGKTFRSVCAFDTGWDIRMATYPSVTIGFDAATGRHFRLLLPGISADDVNLNFTLAADARVNYWRIKAGFDQIREHGGETALLAGDHRRFQKDPAVVGPERVMDLSSRMRPDGRMDWDVPAGPWRILRIGFTPTGKRNAPATEEGVGLDCDKLAAAGIEAHFPPMLGKLLRDAGPLAGATFSHAHIDSWELGHQNWSASFAEEFRARRGYDLRPYLPVMAGGNVIGHHDLAERFLWDVRRTLADCIADNYLARMRRLCHEHGIKFQSEASGRQQFLYDPIVFQKNSDLPMGEFWFGASRPRVDCKVAASVAHLYGTVLAGAEAFTSGGPAARWRETPGRLKPLGDMAFCVGINRFFLTEYTHQPWLNQKPGMTLGPWGAHLERTQTWWEQSVAWMRYLRRCQFLLQQGVFVGDVCHLIGEGAPAYLGERDELSIPLPAGYDYDGCDPEVVMNMSVEDGSLVAPHGMRYRVLLLPDNDRMTPRLLRKVKELVSQGGVVVGPKPVASPSLNGYPDCDAEVAALAAEVWGSCDGKTTTRHRLGTGQVFWGLGMEEVFREIKLPPDFTYSTNREDGALEYIHRRVGGTEIYFVASQSAQPLDATCLFRARGKAPELWDPDTGRIRCPAVYAEHAEGVALPIRFEPYGSVFVVFRKPGGAQPVVSVRRGEETLLKATRPESVSCPAPSNHTDGYPTITNTFTVSLWVNPKDAIGLPEERNTGNFLATKRRLAIDPRQGEIAYGPGHAVAGLSVGTNGVCVFESSARYYPALLVHPQSIHGWTHIALVYQDNQPQLYIHGRRVRTGLKSDKIVHPDNLPGRGPAAFVGEVGGWTLFPTALDDAAIARMAADTRPHREGHGSAAGSPVRLEFTPNGKVRAMAFEEGTYRLQRADGSALIFEARGVLTATVVNGPWDVHFAPGDGAPDKVRFDQLISWSEHSDEGIRHFSGTATYRSVFSCPSPSPGHRVYLDLGDVHHVAEVRLNGRDLGVLWTPPFRVDVSDALKDDGNHLEIKVTNTWVNRLVGDERYPDDSGFGDKPYMNVWPEWLLKNQLRPETRRITFTTYKHFTKDAPLETAGLLGPVTLVRAVEREIE